MYFVIYTDTFTFMSVQNMKLHWQAFHDIPHIKYNAVNLLITAAHANLS